MAFTSGGKIELSDIPTKANGGTFHGVIKSVRFTLLKQNNSSEGGEIMLNAKNGSTYYAAMDVVYDKFRVHSSNGTRMEMSLSNGVFTLPGGVGDYAEKAFSTIEESGRCVFIDNDGKLKPTTQRLQSNCYIISDTVGLCIGEEGNVEVSLTGYVFAYPYKNKEAYHIGDCVCSAPEGTIDIMTRQEIQEYPDKIVGIVTALPSKKQINFKSNDRIWIKIK